MNAPHLHHIFIACTAAFIISSAQPPTMIEPTFCLLLSGKHVGASGDSLPYRYQLNQTGDSGSIIAHGCERLIGRTKFAGVKKSIVNYAMNLTEERYGSPKDSNDFKGELSITALDRNHIIRLSVALTIGTQSDTAMAGLLRLMMKQVDDTLRLPQFKKILSSKKYNIN
jgi:hypothetical protein